MQSSLKKGAGASVPVGLRLVLYGWAGGLVVGGLTFATHPDSALDVDHAAGIGLSVFISITVGCFLAARLLLGVLKVHGARVASLKSRSEGIRHRVSQLNHQTESESPPEKQPSGSGISFVGFYFTSLVSGAAVLMAGLVTLVIEVGVGGISGSPAVFIVPIVGFGFALLGLAGISFDLMKISRDLSRIEQQLDTIEDVLNSSAMARPERIDAALQTAQSFVYKATGVQAGQFGKVRQVAT